MPEWCQNRFEVTGKSVCIDVLLQWVKGAETPKYRHAIQQSIQLFLAGTAGLLKPVRKTAFPICPELVQKGVGSSTPANKAFEQWLELLQNDVVLDIETIRLIDQLYHQTGIGALKWENIPENARERILQWITRQFSDWFGVAALTEHVDGSDCWERLRTYPEHAQPCDMLMILPTRLATELNGSGGVLKGISTTDSFYRQSYGMEWPTGHNVHWQSLAPNNVILLLDSPWYPPCCDVIAAVSALFECEIRHYYLEQHHGLCGYNCYDLGEHVDGGTGLPVQMLLEPAYFLESEEPEQPSDVKEVASDYSTVRG